MLQLVVLFGIPIYNDESSSGRLPKKIQIPYFGYIYRDPTRHIVIADLKEQSIEIASVLSDGISEMGTNSGSNRLPETMDTQVFWGLRELEYF